MDEIPISPSAREHGVLDSLFHYFRSVTDGNELPYRHSVLPPSQQRGSEQVYQVNASSKANGLPRGILAGPHSQRIVFSKEASHHRVFRKAHRSKHCLETAFDVLQEWRDLLCAGKL